MANVKFQCTRIGGDFHVGDGRVLRGPHKSDPNDPTSDDNDGEIDEIPEDVAALGVEKKMGRIVK